MPLPNIMGFTRVKLKYVKFPSIDFFFLLVVVSMTSTLQFDAKFPVKVRGKKTENKETYSESYKVSWWIH